jgi:hypothetical protein
MKSHVLTGGDLAQRGFFTNNELAHDSLRAEPILLRGCRTLPHESSLVILTHLMSFRQKYEAIALH